MRTVKKFNSIIVMALTGAALCIVSNAAQAFPAYSQKEKKPCVYCHVLPNGGGKRNAAGIWYKAHGLSLVGYTPGGAGGAPAPKPKATPQAKATPKPKAKPAPKKSTPKPPAEKG